MGRSRTLWNAAMSGNEFHGPPCPFRAVGFTGSAGAFPLSAGGLSIIAEHNGVPVDKLPRGARNSSSAYTHDWIERLGRLKTEGRPYRHIDGRFLSPREITA